MDSDGQEPAADPFALDPVEPTVVVARERRLQPLYYLHNFRIALTTLDERYAGLLNAEEGGFIGHFNALPEPTQCLLARLVMRKGPLFRRATLAYPEVPDVPQALEGLVALGWLDPDPSLSAEQLVQVLDPRELRLATGIQRARATDRSGIGDDTPQLDLPLQDQPTVHRPLSAWNAHLAGSVVRLSLQPLIRRLQQLFFGNHHQSWSEFVLADLGMKRYESVLLDAQARAFQSREEIDHFHRLNDCSARLDAGEAPAAVRVSAATPETVSGWLHARFSQLHVRLGELCENAGDVEAALRSYRESGAAEGWVKAVRLLLRLNRHEDAHRDALIAQDLPCSEAQREALQKALTRSTRRRDKSAAKRKAGDTAEVIELELPPLAKRARVELAVAARLSDADSSTFYVENALLTSMFGLLCWDALFAPVQGAFFHPFQAGPADLYTPQFRSRREPHFASVLDMLDAGQHEELLWQRYRTKTGVRTHFVRWGRLKPPLLKLALLCIPAAHLRLCFERLLEDLAENTTGMPDLIQFWPEERRYRLIEVKAPGDRLQDNQRRWLGFFARHNMPAAVCQVRWQSTTGHKMRP